MPIKKQNKKKQKGGLRLVRPDKKGFMPIFDMLISKDSSFNLFTYNSLKAFNFNLKVTEENSEYTNLSFNNENEIVTDFLLKFALITNTTNEVLNPYLNSKKRSESIKDYFEEAKLQQYIWESSISNYNPVCPSVANIVFLDNENSLNLLQLIRKTYLNPKHINISSLHPDQIEIEERKKQELDSIISYLEYNVSQVQGLGIISMPMISGSITLNDFMKLNVGDNFKSTKIVDRFTKNYTYSYLIAQIVRLFIDIGVIHFDLHSKNVLIYESKTGNIKSLIIDFGRASNILDKKGDEYFTIEEKIELTRELVYFRNEFSKIARKSNINSINYKMNYISDVIFFLIENDKNKNLRYGKDYPQMNWYLGLYKPIIDTNILIGAFNILKTMMNYESKYSIPFNKYKSENSLIDFDFDINSFYTQIPKISEGQVEFKEYELPIEGELSLIEQEPLEEQIREEPLEEQVREEPLEEQVREEPLEEPVTQVKKSRFFNWGWRNTQKPQPLQDNINTNNVTKKRGFFGRMKDKYKFWGGKTRKFKKQVNKRRKNKKSKNNKIKN
jgi:hypothetical protein